MCIEQQKKAKKKQQNNAEKVFIWAALSEKKHVALSLDSQRKK